MFTQEVLLLAANYRSSSLQTCKAPGGSGRRGKRLLLSLRRTHTALCSDKRQSVESVVVLESEIVQEMWINKLAMLLK